MSSNDPVDSFFNSVKVVNEFLSPVEVGIRQMANFEPCLAGPKNKGNGAQVSEGCELQICGVKKKVKGEKKKGLQNSRNGSKEKGLTKEDGSHITCFHFDVNWSLLVNGFLQSLPTPFKSGQKPSQKMDAEDCPCSYRKSNIPWEWKQTEFNCQSVVTFREKDVQKKEEVNRVSFECLIGFISDHLTPNLSKLDQELQGNDCDREKTILLHPSFDFNYWKVFITSILEGHQVHANRFLRNLKFAKVGGVPSSIVEASHSAKQEGDGSAAVENREEMGRIMSSPSSISLTELTGLLQENPDVRLSSGQDFFRYTEGEGRRLFEELDRDGDGRVTLDDLKVAMRMRELPPRYAHEFMSRTKSHLFSKSFGWKQFSSVMEQKEPTTLRTYTSLFLGKSGTLRTKSEILTSLKNSGLPANEDHAEAMMRFLNADSEGSISYRHFRSFMLLLPPYRLQKDPRGTAVAVPPRVEKPAESVLISALAGCLSCAMSCALMHPVDTIKTQVQATTLTLPEIISKLPQIGARGLYRGSIPAILGQFSSHGLRTGISEASRLVLLKVAPTSPNFQTQYMSSLCSTVLGTAARIPCEVLKQQLQAGVFDNVGEATVGIWRQNGPGGFFRGTVATICREIPFYVAGTGLYEESKRGVQQLLGRDLQPWETVAVGALCGGFTAVMTTPLDVIKTRMMTAQGQSLSATLITLSILHHEGPFGLYKGAVPRFFWVAPLGAFNFAGYELARRAMTRIVNDQTSE